MPSEPPKVFISYNRADRDWAEWIAGAIESAGYEPVIQAWHFRPGENFVLRMQEAAAQTNFTIAVLSETYLKSEYTQPEWAAAFAQDPTGKKRKLIPVRVAECALTGLLAPIVYIDLIGLGEPDAKRALLDGLKPSGRPVQPQPFPGRRAESSISTAPFPPNVGRLHGVLDLPPHYLPREADLSGLKEKLLAGDAKVAIRGMGGTGKSVLAAALAHDSEVRQAFSDGIYWITIGQKPDVLVLQNRLLHQLTGSKETLTTEQEAKDALREALEGRSALLVVDDAWTVKDANALSVDAPPARLLITTRNREVCVGLGAEEHCLGVLSAVQALQMLAERVGEKSPDKLPPEAAQVAKECGYLPLALAMIGAMIQLMPPAKAWPDALARLKRADLEKIKQISDDPSGYLYPNLLRAIEVSIDALESVDQERYLDLAVFPEDQPIPEGPLAILWKLQEMDTRDCMTHLVARSLATWATDGSSLILHDLQRDLIHKRREKELPGLHLQLVEAWDALPKLPDAYAWRWIAYHMMKAERKEDLRQVLLNFNYLQAKLTATDPNALIADYDYLPEEKGSRLVQSALRLSANVLARDPRQLAGQLTGRLLGNTSPSIQALLKRAAEREAWPWLCPLQPSLTAPGGPLIRKLEGHSGGVSAVAVTPDGRHVVSGSADKTLRVWDLATGETKTTLQGHTSSVNAVAVTPDGRHVVSGSADKTLRVWDLATGETKTTLQGHTSSVNAVAVTPDGRHVVSGSADKTLRVWDLATGETKTTLQGDTESTGDHRPLYDWVSAVAVTPDGRHVVSGSHDKTLRVWDLATGETKMTLQGHTDSVNAVAVTPDGRHVVSGSDDDALRVWDLATGETKTTLQGHTCWFNAWVNAVNAVAVTPDGHHVVSSSWDTLRVWDLATGKTKMTLQGHFDSFNAVAVTPDGRHVVFGFHDTTLRVWNLATGETKMTLQGDTSSVNAVAVTPDGRHVVSGSDGDGGTLRVWDLATGKTKTSLHGHTSSVNAVAVSPDGRHVVSGSADTTLRVWDLATGETKMTLQGHTDSVNAVAVTPDGHHVVSGSYDKTLRVWDLATGEIKMTLQGHTYSVSAVAVTPDGRHVVSGSDGDTLSVWDLKDGKEILTFTGEGGMCSCAVAPDGRTIVGGESSGRVHFLRVVEADPTIPPIGDTKIQFLST